MKKLTVILALLLTVCLLLPLTSCKDNKPETDPGEKDPQNDPSGEQTEELEDLEVVDLQGMEFKMLWPEVHVDGHFVHNELDSDGMSSNEIDKEVHRRTMLVETAYHVDVVVDTMFCSTIGKDVRNYYLNGETPYQAVATNVKFLLTAATEGALADWNVMKYYDEQSWWDNKAMQDYAIGGARYFGMGDIIYSDNFYPYCVFANLRFAEDHGVNEDFYDLALNHEWTYEKMLQLATNLPEIGPDEQWDYTATYGILLNANTARALYYGFGKTVVRRTDDDGLEWVMTPAYTEDILDTIQRLFNDPSCIGYATDDDIGHNEPGLTHAQTALKMFDNDQALFYAEELIVSERLNTASSSMDFAILPMPLYDDSQTDYYCVLNDAVVLSVPTLADLDVVSLVLSALGKESVNTLTPAFFNNVLTYRYMTNPKSVDTLQLILSSVKALDIATLLDWGGMMAGFKSIALTGEGSFSTLYAENYGVADAALQAFVRQVQFYQN